MKFFNRLEEWILASLLAAMTLLTFVQVVLRYVFNTGFTWALELTTVIFAFMIFLGISYCVRVNAHIGVDALVRLMSPGMRRASSIVAVLLCMLYAGMVIYGSYVYVSKMYLIGVELEDLPIPIWATRVILPIGYLLLMARFAQVLYALLSRRTDSLALADEAAEAMKLRSEEATA